VAQILRQTFRASDLVARLGGDEFVILAPEASLSSITILTARLQHNVQAYNAQQGHWYTLALSVGSAVYDPTAPRSIEELLAQADTAMYAQKHGKGR